MKFADILRHSLLRGSVAYVLLRLISTSCHFILTSFAHNAQVRRCHWRVWTTQVTCCSNWVIIWIKRIQESTLFRNKSKPASMLWNRRSTVWLPTSAVSRPTSKASRRESMVRLSIVFCQFWNVFRYMRRSEHPGFDQLLLTVFVIISDLSLIWSLSRIEMNSFIVYLYWNPCWFVICMALYDFFSLHQRTAVGMRTVSTIVERWPLRKKGKSVKIGEHNRQRLIHIHQTSMRMKCFFFPHLKVACMCLKMTGLIIG